MLARASGGAAAPKNKGKGTGGRLLPQKEPGGGGNTASSSTGAMRGRRGGRLSVRPSVPAGTQGGVKISGRVFGFFFFFGVFSCCFLSPPLAGYWEVSSSDSGSSGCGCCYCSFSSLATTQRFSECACIWCPLPAVRMRRGRSRGGAQHKNKRESSAGPGSGWVWGQGRGRGSARERAPGRVPGGGVQSASGRWRRFLLTAAFLLCFIELLQRVQQFLWGEDVRGPY